MAKTRLREKRLAGSRSEILDVTRTVLARVGAEKLTLELVAAELGISKQALYYYFPSRAALLFELVTDELFACANAVHAACAATDTAADSIEALIRTYTGYFLPRLGMHLLITLHTVPSSDVEVTPEHLARIRPVNDLLYGETEKRIRNKRRGRRLAFTAYLAALGLLTMRSIVDRLADPLVHSDEDLVQELVDTFRLAAEKANRS